MNPRMADRPVTYLSQSDLQRRWRRSNSYVSKLINSSEFLTSVSTRRLPGFGAKPGPLAFLEADVERLEEQWTETPEMAAAEAAARRSAPEAEARPSGPSKKRPGRPRVHAA